MLYIDHCVCIIEVGTHNIKGTNEQFLEEKESILRDTEKRVYFPRDSIHGLRSEHSTTKLSDLLMERHKSTKYNVYKSVRYT